jgi:hypothetical protein
MNPVANSNPATHRVFYEVTAVILNVIQDVPGMEALPKGYLLGSRFLGAEAHRLRGAPFG